jgi:hypothetical protein
MPKKNKAQSMREAKSGSVNYVRISQSESPSGVHESSIGGAGGRRIETLLSDIVTRLDRIEEKIDENVYPPESAIKPEYIRKVKRIQAKLSKGKEKTYRSMDEFIQSLTQ